MTKNFIQAPLPFQGQKRKWLKHFQKAIKQHFNDKTIFVDLFGGSGLLSYFTHQALPNARVIYNDFDNYSQRLRNVDGTNRLLHQLREILKDYPDAKPIKEPYRTRIINLLTEADKTGYVDYITLSSSLMFSMKYRTDLAGFVKEALYNNIRQNDYNADGYLDGLEIVSLDYRDLYRRWRGHPDVVFLIDPPYLSTDATTYTGYWRLSNYLDVLQTLKDTNYFYFTSNKSSILEFCEWIEKNLNAENPFSGAVKMELQTTMNHTASYTDIMIYKKKKDE